MGGEFGSGLGSRGLMCWDVLGSAQSLGYSDVICIWAFTFCREVEGSPEKVQGLESFWWKVF